MKRFLLPLLGLVLYTLLLRWGTFLPSVINHDESTYIVIAGEILRGEVYLDQVVDTKPASLYWLYTLLYLLGDGKIWAFRFFTALFVAFTAFCLLKASTKASGSREVGMAAALAYPLMCSVYTYYGISPNAELFFNALTAAAIALAIPPLLVSSPILLSIEKDTAPAQSARFKPVLGTRASANDTAQTFDQNPFNKRFPSYALAGFLLGLAVTIKPMAAAEALAIGLFLLWWGWKKKAFIAAIFQACLPLTLAFLLPLAALWTYYYQLGMLQDLLFYNWEVTKRYPIEVAAHLRLLFMGDYALRYSPLLIVAVVAWRQLPSHLRPWTYFLLLQLALVTVVVLATGKRFGHYQIQLHPVLASLAALWWLPLVSPPKWLRGISFQRGAAWLFLLASFIGAGMAFKYSYRVDPARDLAAYLQPRLAPEEEIFTINSLQILYHLLDRPVPTPYVHPSLLFYDHHVKALDIDLQAEADRIFARPQLTYLIVREKDWKGALYATNPIMVRAKEQFSHLEITIGDYLILSR